jgi:hypothetical protein
VLADITGAAWPDTETGAVDRFLPVHTENGRRSFEETGATSLAVSLSRRDNQGVLAAADGREYYVESANASPWDTQRQRDDEARKHKHQPSSQSDYQLSQLFDRAAHLAGLLAMAAVNYDTIDARRRDSVKEIFKDSNLDYRTVEEWDALMKESTGSDMGLLTATARWWDDLRQNRPATDPPVLDRIAQEMAVTGFSGMILADFTHSGGSPQDIVHPLPPNARCGRLTRPGAILLANLNIDDPLSITTPLPSPLPDRRPILDVLKDNVIAGIDDELGLTQFSVQHPTRLTAVGYDMVLKVHGADARRIRVFEVTLSDPSPLWPRRVGADTGGAHLERHTVPAGGSGTVDFYVEALTLPGDPVLQVPIAPAPFGRDGVTPVAPSRKSGDVWVELLHRDGGADLPNLRDVALFTIAPWLMFSNLQPTEHLYVVYIAGEFGNHPTVADLAPAFRTFLDAQAVQPVLTFDTSWLHVGHVDEVAIFVPATGGQGYRLLMSSTQLATDIFREADALHTSDAAVHPLTEMFRGKFWQLPDGSEIPAAVSVAALLTSHRDGNAELDNLGDASFDGRKVIQVLPVTLGERQLSVVVTEAVDTRRFVPNLLGLTYQEAQERLRALVGDVAQTGAPPMAPQLIGGTLDQAQQAFTR